MACEDLLNWIYSILIWTSEGSKFRQVNGVAHEIGKQDKIPLVRARKLYTSARIYEWKLGEGEWKFPITRPTGQVDFLGCS